MTDEKLLRQYVVDRSPDAFRQIVERYLTMVHAICRREVRNPEMAQDVTQAVFVLLAQKAPRLRRGTVLSGWLFTTARFASKVALRNELRRRHYETQAVEQMPRYEDQLQQAETAVMVEPWLNEALSALRPKDREALLLRYAEERSMHEIGERCGISEHSAHMRVTRALEKLRQDLRKRGVNTPETSALGIALPVLLTGSILTLPSTVSAAGISQAVPTILAGTSGATIGDVHLIQLSQEVNQAMKILQMKTAAMLLAGCLAAGGLTMAGIGAVTQTQPATEAVSKPASIEYTITDLGTLPGFTLSSATSINNKGEIVGSLGAGSGGREHIFYYHDGAMRDIAVPPGYDHYEVTAINDRGMILGAAFKADATGGFPYALIGTKDKMSLYAPPVPIKKIHFTGINDNGDITGMYMANSAGDNRKSTGFIITDGKFQSIPTLVDVGFSGQARLCINNKRQVAGYVQSRVLVPSDTSMPSETFVYAAGKKALLPEMPGYRYGPITAINSAGDIIGYAYTGGRQQVKRAFLYRKGIAGDLGALREFPNSEGYALNATGVVVGDVIKGYEGIPDYIRHAAIFKGGNARDLNSLIDPEADWQLVYARGINDKGQIVGGGVHNGARRAFLLTPKP
jgi:RNA polymerase sigma factor (sigma-70 family)